MRGIFFFLEFFLSEEAVAYLCQRDYTTNTSTVHVCLFLIISPSNNLHLKGFLMKIKTVG